ncbi:MAG: ferredoxin [Bacteroidota bacterium]
MEVSVDQDLCISCGLCVNHCPDVFDWNKDGKADAMTNPVPATTEDCCREAMDDCPTVAIKEA